MQAKSVWRIRKQLAPYLFISPFFILFLIFMLYPFIYAFVISFADWNGIGIENIRWVRVQNYIRMTKDNVFLQSLKNGIIIYFMYVPVLVFLSIMLAVLLTRTWLKGRGFFRAAAYIPNITSTVAAAYIFSLIFNSSENGIVNLFLGALGMPKPISWFGSPLMARMVLSLLMIWRWLGYDTILMMAGLSAINTDVFDAASIDGANARQVFFRITVPLMKNFILFTCIMSTIGTFSMFTEPKILTDGVGGPFNTTMSTVLYIYNTSFKQLRMGYSSALAIIYFIIMLLLTVMQLKVGNREQRVKQGG